MYTHMDMEFIHTKVIINILDCDIFCANIPH